MLTLKNKDAAVMTQEETNDYYMLEEFNDYLEERGKLLFHEKNKRFEMVHTIIQTLGIPDIEILKYWNDEKILEISKACCGA